MTVDGLLISRERKRRNLFLNELFEGYFSPIASRVDVTHKSRPQENKRTRRSNE